MTDPTCPDVVPLLGFDAIDFTEQVLDVELPVWQRRILIDQFGAGPEPAATPDGDTP